MKVLLVVHKNWFEWKCPPFWPEQYHAICAHPEVTMKVTGPRWDGWVQDYTLRRNIERLMPDADVVYLWRPFGIVEFCGITGADAELKQLKVSAYQDDPRNGVIEARRAKLDLLFYHDHWDRQFFQDCGIRSVYLPLAVNLDLFNAWTRPVHQRKIPVILTGNVQRTTYPLRARYNKLLRQGMIPGHIRKTPGYRMQNLNSVMREQRQYASMLLNSKISIVSTCPHIPLTLRKYFESMAAGCAIIGDVPHSPPDDVRECLNVVSTKMGDDALIKHVKRLLSDPAEIERQRERNRKVAERYSYAAFAEKWVATVKQSLAEKNG